MCIFFKRTDFDFVQFVSSNLRVWNYCCDVIVWLLCDFWYRIYVPYVYEIFFHKFHKLYSSGSLNVTVKLKTNLTPVPEKLFVMPSLILRLCDKIQESLWEESFVIQFAWLLTMACYWSSSIQKISTAEGSLIQCVLHSTLWSLISWSSRVLNVGSLQRKSACISSSV